MTTVVDATASPSTAIATREPELSNEAFLALSVAEQRSYVERVRPPTLTNAEFLALTPTAREAHVQAVERHGWRYIACVYNEVRDRIASGQLQVPDSVRRGYGLKPARKAVSSVDEALARARAREVEKAERTPRRLWTPAMRDAMAAKEPERKARR